MNRTIHISGAGFLVAMFFIVGSLQAQNVDLGERYNETAGGYSICPPGTWNIMSLPSVRNKIFISPTENNGYYPKITFSDGDWDGRNITAWVNAEIEELFGIYNNFQILGTSIFVADNGMAGIKKIVSYNDGTTNVRGLFYFFTVKNKKTLIVFCSCSSRSNFDNVFDRSLKTLIIN